MRRLTFLLTFVLALPLAFLCNRSEATLFYDFEEAGTGTVLATLELASLPATHTEVLGLTFTPAGQSIFYFGDTYLGTFDQTGGDTPAAMISDGLGGLRSHTSGDFVGFGDLDPPPTTKPIFVYIFSIEATDKLGGDRMQRVEFSVYGDWRLIPEPSSLALAVSSVLVGVVVGRRRKR